MLYLRIIEADVEDDPAYFDMQFIVEIGPGNVQLEIVKYLQMLRLMRVKKEILYSV